MNITRARMCGLMLASLATAFAQAQFTEQWTQPARYNGTASGNDRAVTVLADKRGNTIAIGTAIESGGGNGDAVAVKYSPTGSQLWRAPYDGNANLRDGATAAHLDNDGNVYVCGFTTLSSGPFGDATDMVVVKFRAADGQRLWAQTIDIGESKNEIAEDIYVSKTGFVYVTGHARTQGTAGSTTWVTAKLDAATGEVEDGWPVLYALGADVGAIGIAVRESTGHVYVTGQVVRDGFDQWMTCRYPGGGFTTDPYGNEEWTHFEVGSFGGKPCRPYDIAVDVDGDVFVCGYVARAGTDTDYRTVSYDTNGNDRWTVADQDVNIGTHDRARSLALQTDVTGNAVFVYVTGHVGAEFTSSFGTLKYNADNAGTQQVWYQAYGPSGDHDAFSIACGGDGNAYVTGYRNASGNFDYATLRYEKGGSQIGTTIYYDGPGSPDDIDQGAKVANSCAGLAHVTGFSTGATSEDFLTLRYYQPSQDAEVLVDSSAIEVTVGPGSVFSGTIPDSLTTADDDRLVIRPGAVAISSQYPAAINVRVTSPYSEPSELCVMVEAHTQLANINQRIELYDWVQGQYREIDLRLATTSDSVVHANVPYDPRIFVKPVTLEIKARISFKADGAVAIYPWQARVDMIKFEVLD